MTIADTAEVRTDVHADAKLLLERAWEAVGEIESQAGEIADALTELSGIAEVPEDVGCRADDIGSEAGDLANALSDRLSRLRKELAAWADDDTD